MVLAKLHCKILSIISEAELVLLQMEYRPNFDLSSWQNDISSEQYSSSLNTCIESVATCFPCSYKSVKAN